MGPPNTYPLFAFWLYILGMSSLKYLYVVEKVSRSSCYSLSAALALFLATTDAVSTSRRIEMRVLITTDRPSYRPVYRL